MGYPVRGDPFNHATYQNPIRSCRKIGSSDISSDKFSIEQKKTAEHFVYLNNHKQIYNNEQQFSISCMGALQP